MCVCVCVCERESLNINNLFHIYSKWNLTSEKSRKMIYACVQVFFFNRYKYNRLSTYKVCFIIIVLYHKT